MELRPEVALIVAALVAPAAHAEPFLTRNQHALVAMYGLPSPLPARLSPAGNGRIAGAVNWSNNETHESSGDAQYTLDVEIVELRLYFERAFGERYAFRVELPWRSTSGGSLDGLVDDWHETFRLPGGSRGRLPEDQLLIEYREGATKLLHFHESASGIGDLSVAAGYQLQSSERSAIAAWLTVKAPTGSADDLTGSGAADLAVTLSGQSRLAEHWQLFGQSSVAWLGEGDVLSERQRSFAWTLMGGLTWNGWRRLDLTVQVEANSRIYDGLHSEFDGDAVVLTFGGGWRTAGGWRFDMGVSEDLQAGASPDVNFILAAVREY